MGKRIKRKEIIAFCDKQDRKAKALENVYLCDPRQKLLLNMTASGIQEVVCALRAAIRAEKW